MSWLTNVATQSNQATQSSQESWWSSWSGLSQPFTSKGKKRDLYDDENNNGGNCFVVKVQKRINHRGQQVVHLNKKRMNQKVV